MLYDNNLTRYVFSEVFLLNGVCVCVCACDSFALYSMMGHNLVVAIDPFSIHFHYTVVCDKCKVCGIPAITKPKEYQKLLHSFILVNNFVVDKIFEN